jgi:radial spoke head protein 4/6
VPNIIEEMRLFEKVGVGFGEEEHFVLFKSLTKFAQVRGAKQVRLWGKIFCSKKDYYIVESVVDGADEGDLAPGTEPRGSGVNKFTYFANTDRISYKDSAQRLD